MRIVSCCALLTVSAALLAAEPAPTPGARVPPPGYGTGIGTPMGRFLMTFEVESLVVKPDDKAAMAKWAELAGLGYHVVASTPQTGGATLLLLERTGVPGVIQVPAVVSADKELADAVRFKVAQAQQERGSRPAAPPAPGTPVAPVAPAPGK